MQRESVLPHTYTSRAATLLPPGLDTELAAEALPSLDRLDTTDLVQPAAKERLESASDFPTDITIIGAGPAGYVAAIRAAQLGARVVVVEKGEVGGTCLNVGCIPTKVLLASVAVLDHVKSGAEFGVKVKNWELDIPAMMARKDRVVKQLTSGVEGLFRKNRVKLVRGSGRIADAHTVIVDTGEGGEEIKTRAILIATGSVPAPLPVPGLELGGNVWTSTEALSFDKVPEKMLIVGAGAIGLEAGYTFARLGTDVLVVEMMSQILPAADGETAKALQKGLERAGMKFMVNSTVTRAEDITDTRPATPLPDDQRGGKLPDDRKGGKRVWIKSTDKEEPGEFDTVLVAIGRRTVIDGLGLDDVGVKHDRGRIIVNDRMQTSVPSIYAAGDCTGEPMLAHVAWTESAVAVEHAMGMESRMDFRAYPACVYTTPECAAVGLTEEKARERYRDVRVGKFSFTHNGKAMGIGEAEGFVKFVTEPRYGQILGVHMVGPHVTDLIAEMVLAMRNELTVDEVIATIHPHPTLSEVVQEAAMDAQARAIHK